MHGKDVGKFTFWDNQVFDMVGQTAGQLKQQMIEVKCISYMFNSHLTCSFLRLYLTHKCNVWTNKSLIFHYLKEGEDDDKVYPELLDVLLGRNMAAKVKIQPRFGSCNVYEVKEDDKTIKAILEKMEPNEVKFPISFNVILPSTYNVPTD